MPKRFRRKRTKKRHTRPRRRLRNTAIQKMALIPQKCVGLIPITLNAQTASQTDVYTFNRYDLGAEYNPWGNYGPNSTKRF